MSDINIDENTEFEEIPIERIEAYFTVFGQIFHNGKTGNDRKYFIPKYKPMTEEESKAAYERHIKDAADYFGFTVEGDTVEGDVEWKEATCSGDYEDNIKKLLDLSNPLLMEM